jgi:hypothetical protein
MCSKPAALRLVGSWSDSSYPTCHVPTCLQGNESAEPQRPLYTVLEQRAAPLAPGTLLGTDHVYVIPGTQTAEKGAGGGAGGARKPGK